ncbi:hypothetical protein [Calidithermus roseus]|uniref:LPS-assembly protein LptD n=1 Tax=Calidithermus roseus TaxID=1644118 RepID=A0A399F2K0_9DEIN|nr:hypothetical protein [Calidithermus roseus]RIH89906.1 LPS-assembly protein LptD [Calidithermus roseus]
MVRKLLLFVFFGTATTQALANDPALPYEKCADAPYLAETPDGIVGGVNVEYDGSIAIFSDGACFESKGLQVRAREIRFDQDQNEVSIQGLTAQTRAYRFRAQQGVVRDRIFRAKGIGLTTCKCGEDLRIVAQEAAFNTESGLLILEQGELESYGIGLARLERLQIAIDQPITTAIPGLSAGGGGSINVPFRFGYSISDGPTLGVEDLPLLGEEDRVNTTLTLLGSNLSNPASRTVTIGAAVSESGSSLRFRMVFRSQWFDLYSRLESGPLFFTVDTNRDQATEVASRKSLFEMGLRQAFRLEGLLLSPFGRIAEEQTSSDNDPQPHSAADAYVSGLTAGLELRYPLELKEGAVALRFEPWTLGAAYNNDLPYLAAGFRLEGRYSRDFTLRLAYDYGLQNRTSRYLYERREPVSRVWGELDFSELALRSSFDFLDRELGASVRYSPKLPDGVLTGEFRYRDDFVPNNDGFDQQRELLLAFEPNPLNCTYSFALAPNLGYDFWRGGFSRAGLELRYADCCLIWKVGYQQVFLPQVSGEVAAGRFSFGLELR